MPTPRRWFITGARRGPNRVPVGHLATKGTWDGSIKW